jgi:nicotinate phosphoribosyltransferase
LRDGVAEAEVIAPRGAAVPDDARGLTVLLVRGGEVVANPTLDELRAHHRAVMAELPPEALQLDDGEPVIPTVYADGGR